MFTCIEKPDVCDCGCSGRHTIDAILEVFLWSLQALLFGAWPRKRHDNQPWRREDSHRKSKAGSAFGFFAYLCEVRGDWAWFKQMFGFKGWASENICWRCEANKSDKPYWDCTLSALWRAARLTSAGLVRLLRSQGQAVNPLFSAPGFTAELICIDVLHACDLGVTQEVLGSIFFEALGVFALGSNRVAQVVDLFRHMQAHYKRMGTTNRLSFLTVEMINQQNKPQKFFKQEAPRHAIWCHLLWRSRRPCKLLTTISTP